MSNGATKITSNYDYYITDYINEYHIVGTESVISNVNHLNRNSDFETTTVDSDLYPELNSTSSASYHEQVGQNPNGDSHGSSQLKSDWTESLVAQNGTLIFDRTGSSNNHTSYNDSHSNAGTVSEYTDSVSGEEVRTIFHQTDNGHVYNYVDHQIVDGDNTVTHFNNHYDLTI